MSEAFEILSSSLQEAIEDTKTENLKRVKRTIEIEPIYIYEPFEIKGIRKKIGITQNLFAKYLGVSLKTVEAWESGRNKPSGPSCRLLSLLDTGKVSI